jgi:hypothetical protein
MFRKNISPLPSGLKSKPSMKMAEASSKCAGFLLGLLFDPDDGGGISSETSSSPNLTALQPRRTYSSQWPPRTSDPAWGKLVQFHNVP